MLILFAFLFFSCGTGDLEVIATISDSIDESSALEVIPGSNLIWTLQDSENSNHIYALDKKGAIVKDLTIVDAVNFDWEDLTTDNEGNLYIGDFGNNHKNRSQYSIYKILNPEKSTSSVAASKITYVLPKDTKPKDFEAFFIFKEHFYIFSKSPKKFEVFKVPNQIGHHEAELVSEFNLKGKHNRITSADINASQDTVILLNHDKLWLLTNFKEDLFFEGSIKSFEFNHNSQKEGVCFISDSLVYISDERNKSEGGNIYGFHIY